MECLLCVRHCSILYTSLHVFSVRALRDCGGYCYYPSHCFCEEIEPQKGSVTHLSHQLVSTRATLVSQAHTLSDAKPDKNQWPGSWVERQCSGDLRAVGAVQSLDVYKEHWTWNWTDVQIPAFFLVFIKASVNWLLRISAPSFELKIIKPLFQCPCKNTFGGISDILQDWRFSPNWKCLGTGFWYNA